MHEIRVGRTARLGQKGDSLLFLQSVEMDYLKDLEKHGVSLAEFQLQKVLETFRVFGQKHLAKRILSIEMHPWLVGLQNALEAFIAKEVVCQLFLFLPHFAFEYYHRIRSSFAILFNTSS